MPRPKKLKEPATTARRLGATLKACRDSMRKDKGLSGEVDRLPMLTWIMFLKFLDDVERIRSDEATLKDERFLPVIDPPYRWRDWNRRSAEHEDGGLHNPMTGDALIAFINQDEAVRPDGKRGPGLFAYLRSLEGAHGVERSDVIASVFRGTTNRMQSGYILRDVLDKVTEIHFSSSDEIHTLSRLYESLLMEMRDAAGDSGEFYTPRPLIRMIVNVIDPQPGEIILDPAAGTGGFLVEAYEHLRPLAKTVEEYSQLQNATLFGVEAKPLPYLLCQMNLVLHGLETPHIDPLNALRFRLGEIGDRDRVDVIMTNPPFGGEEEKGIQLNFPSDLQTSETAVLFLQLIMRRLRRAPHPGRAAVIVPDGTLFGDGVYARVKAALLRDFNLHTVVRLPLGVFEPYTSIPTNVLFFDRGGPTTEIWYYEHPLPTDRKRYTKTKPLRFDEFEPMLTWWTRREPNLHAWLVSPSDVFTRSDDGQVLTCDLDVKNPRTTSGFDFSAPERDLAEAIADETELMGLLKRLSSELEALSDA
jgi:type I restriction enzyme M protein